MPEIKDKVYEKHLKKMERDRPKVFDLSQVMPTERYVAAWSERNKLKQVGVEPRCKCGKPRAYYGTKGGYSMKCKDCNAKNSARQRAARAKAKGAP